MRFSSRDEGDFWMKTSLILVWNWFFIATILNENLMKLLVWNLNPKIHNSQNSQNKVQDCSLSYRKIMCSVNNMNKSENVAERNINN